MSDTLASVLGVMPLVLQLGELLLQLLLVVLRLLVPLVPIGLWCAWWLCCVDWKKAWPVLAGGAWVPVVLLMFVAALAWSQIDPEPYTRFQFVTLPSFWWQLGAVTGLTLLALFCGWLQGQLRWAPAEVSFDPPAHADHAHAGHH